MMQKHWKVSCASVVISITGGAQDFTLPPRLHQTFQHGLAKAAKATNAWIVTGGTDSGVMQLVGTALAEYDAHVACVGIVTWGVVLGREGLEGSAGELREVTRDKPNSVEGANLEPNHTHYLMVDTGKVGSARALGWTRTSPSPFTLPSTLP